MNWTIELVSKKYVVVNDNYTGLNYCVSNFGRVDISKQKKSNDIKNTYLRSTTVAYE